MASTWVKIAKAKWTLAALLLGFLEPRIVETKIKYDSIPGTTQKLFRKLFHTKALTSTGSRPTTDESVKILLMIYSQDESGTSVS